MNDDLISRQATINTTINMRNRCDNDINDFYDLLIESFKVLPSKEPEIIRCKDCKYWRQQTNYAGIKLSFGSCESDNMWRSLYGETVEVDHIDTDDDFYCGYAERRANE